jgi:DNA helicase-2/ATP-dependent DNA helicase PcrA
VDFSLLRDEEKRDIIDGLVARKDASKFLDGVRREKQQLEWPQVGLAAQYQNRLTARRLLDFDDLFLYVTRLFVERPAIAAAYRDRFTHIAIDEFQDTNFAQYRFITSLVPPHDPPVPPLTREGTSGSVSGAQLPPRRRNQPNFCVIGDPDQAIYGFAGRFRAFEAFTADFPHHRVCRLSENYRSQGVIVEAAIQVIGKNRTQLPRHLTARIGKGLPLAVARYHTDRHEAEMIVRKIETLLGGSSSFTIDSGWAQADDEPHRYGLGDIAVLYRLHAQSRPIAEALERSGLPFRCYGAPSTIEDLEAFIADDTGPRGDAIRLMTLHRAKGLEFPAVFIAGCEEGVLPYERSEDPEEERRLFFVGMTRAKQRLFLSSAAKRFLFGETRRGEPSSYLSDIETELRRLEELRGPRRPVERESQQSLF